LQNRRINPPSANRPETVSPPSSVPAISLEAPAPPCEIALPDSGPSDPSQWFAEQVHPHDSQLKAYLRGSFPAVHDVEDVVQESYLRLWRARATQPILNAKAFLFRVARNVTLDLLRHGRRSPIDVVGDLEALSVIEDKPGVADQVSTAEKLTLLAEAIATLPPRGRELIMLCKLKGLSHRQAGEQLGITEKTVDEHVSRALKRLGQELRSRGLDRYYGL
jgi:RNA polymerase sigma factor (sigma-70 family)